MAATCDPSDGVFATGCDASGRLSSTLAGMVAPSSSAASNRMRANRRRDTKPELALRRELHRRGLRYRVDYPILPRRRADIAFTRARVAVFVDGCFWHGCPLHHTVAVSNATFWASKVLANRRRDLDTNTRASAHGWRVIRLWEHEDVATAADRVEAALRTGERHS
jgi:DNA mismatch endonuclease (patch repair protein)